MSALRNAPLLSVVLLSSLLGLTLPIKALGDPPQWAPAHGRRHHHDDDDEHHHRDHDYYREVRQSPHPAPYHERYGDYGIRSGRCNNHTVAQVLGGVAGGTLGGVLGSQVGQGSNAGAIVGAVAGTVLGAIIGDRIGRGMDPNDRFCTGRALDFADDGRSVNWLNPQSQVNYLVTPLRSYQTQGTLCREFTTRMGHRDLSDTLRQTACRRPSGDWEIL